MGMPRSERGGMPSTLAPEPRRNVNADKSIRRRRVTQPRDVQVRRIYDDPSVEDGIRVLVDRRWPRGVSKARAELDEWCTDVAPSDALRKWYGHSPEKFEEFGSRYRQELEEPERASALRYLRLMTAHGRLTLLTATKRAEISQAAILAEILRA